MKKTLLALGVLGAFSGLALAASNVTLYGLIDTGVLVNKAKDTAAVVSQSTGFNAGARWGLKGVEELGNGYSVGFILEQGFNSDTGAEGSSGLAFNRESALYVQGGFGKLTVGRLGTLGYAQTTGILRGAVFGASWGASGLNSKYDNTFTRVDNAVAYQTPSFGGVTIHAMYSNKMSGDEKEKWSTNDHYYGLGAKVTAGGFDGSAIFEVKDNKETANAKAMYHFTIGGSYNFGVVTPFAIYQYQTQDNLHDQHYIGLGAKAPVAGGTVLVGAKYIYREADGEAKKGDSSKDKSNVWTIGAGYEYPFSKRTKVYGYAGYADGGKAWKDKKDVYFNGYQVTAGVVHSF